jgi:hypothetical protein
MTDEITITEDQIAAAAEELAGLVLVSISQFHVKETKYGVEYRTYYLTASQEVGTAFAVDEFLAGRSTVLKVCGVVRPESYKATASTWAIARDILRRATRILAKASKINEDAALAKTLAPKPRGVRHAVALASRN